MLLITDVRLNRRLDGGRRMIDVQLTRSVNSAAATKSAVKRPMFDAYAAGFSEVAEGMNRKLQE